ncbi:helix-turn-helix transcriptional regulator [Paenibacillus sp. 2KB_20]|uniref:helix-turn-helix transcriptional regulator n=1 Tax=Paenibacillus sp. 2KB_20 TaxID=3232977 RepID=UPI003F9A4860
MSNHEELLTIPQLADRLKISKRKAYELKHRTGFPSYNVGQRQTRVIWSEVDRWMRANCLK